MNEVYQEVMNRRAHALEEILRETSSASAQFSREIRRLPLEVLSIYSRQLAEFLRANIEVAGTAEEISRWMKSKPKPGEAQPEIFYTPAFKEAIWQLMHEGGRSIQPKPQSMTPQRQQENAKACQK